MPPMTDTCQLVYELRGREHTIEVTRDRNLIGRNHECEISIPDDSVSRVHGVLERSKTGWEVCDQQSRNGIYINERKVDRARVKHNDRIRVGRITLLFLHPGAPESALDESHFLDPKQDSSYVSQTLSVDQFKRELLASTAVTAEDEGSGTRSPIIEQPVRDPSSLDESAAPWAIPLFSRATEALISSTDLDDMFNRIMDLVFEWLPADRGCIFLYDPSTREKTLKVMRTKRGQGEEKFGISSTVVQQAIDHRRSVLVMDSLSDEELSSKQSIILNQIQSAMCAPLTADDRVAGLLYVDTQSLHAPFRRQHLEALTALAFLSAAALEQARLRESVRKEQAIRETLSRYFAPAVVDSIIASPNGEFGHEMLAEERQVSVLFMDLVKFTGVAEQLPPLEAAQLLNSFLGRMTDAVFAHEGTLDKFTGDGLMAIYGAPLDQEDHALRAVRSSLAMKKELAALNQELDLELSIRVGINSGMVLAGDIGAPKRRDYTVIGDTVNVASRLEANVAQPGEIVIGPETFRAVESAFECRCLGEKDIKGKSQQIKAYQVLHERKGA